MKNKSANSVEWKLGREFIVQLCAVYWQCVTWLLDNKTPSCKQAKLFTATLDQALKITDELMAARQLQRLCPSSGAKLMEVHYDKKRWEEIVKIQYWSQIAGPGLQSYSHKTEKVLLNLGWINKISKVAHSTSAVKFYHLHQVNYCSTPLFFFFFEAEKVFTFACYPLSVSWWANSYLSNQPKCTVILITHVVFMFLVPKKSLEITNASHWTDIIQEKKKMTFFQKLAALPVFFFCRIALL